MQWVAAESSDWFLQTSRTTRSRNRCFWAPNRGFARRRVARSKRTSEGLPRDDPDPIRIFLIKCRDGNISAATMGSATLWTVKNFQQTRQGKGIEFIGKCFAWMELLGEEFYELHFGANEVEIITKPCFFSHSHLPLPSWESGYSHSFLARASAAAKSRLTSLISTLRALASHVILAWKLYGKHYAQVK